jgi:5'(3')-deoxyribonucleotidase
MLVKLKRKSWFLSFFASFVYNSLNRFVTLRTLARFLYQESFSKSILKSHFDNEPMKLDALFVTSLTNNYEDIRIATYYRRFKKTTVIGTIRSWDNLTSHGCLRFIPDIFLSHSEFTTQCFIEIQNLDQSLIYQWRVPAYERLVNYLYNGKSSSSRKRQHFTYASMGLATNPDDKNVIEWLINTWKTMPDHFELTILQHPKFAIDVTESRNVKVRRFDYLDSRLEEYYEFLSSQDIVVCGGTSVVLDCLFTKTPMVLVNFEIVRQPYWISALRYFDSIDHTKDLFSRFNFTIANNPTQLIELLISKQVKQIELEDYTYFLGNTGVDAAGSLINILTNIPRNQ